MTPMLNQLSLSRPHSRSKTGMAILTGWLPTSLPESLVNQDEPSSMITGCLRSFPIGAAMAWSKCRGAVHQRMRGLAERLEDLKSTTNASAVLFPDPETIARSFCSLPALCGSDRHEA